MSSISSLRELDIRSASPSPFTPSGRRSPPSPTTPGANQSNGWGQREKEESGFHETVDLLKKGHLEAARVAVKAGALREELEDEIIRDCEGLRGFLQAAQVCYTATEGCQSSKLTRQIIDEISPRSQDSIVGTGEKLACKIVAAALRDRVSCTTRADESK